MNIMMNDQRPLHYVDHLPNARFFKSGGSGYLYTIPHCPAELIKQPSTRPASIRDLAIEKRVYGRLGSHRNIIQCLRIEDYGIHLERASYGSLREYYAGGGTASLKERVIWCRDVANVVHYIHQKNVRHADLSGRNLLLDAKRTIRLCDFAGSAIDDDKATVWAGSGFHHPDERELEDPTIRAEIHALGSTIYEIVTCSRPYNGIDEEIIDLWLEEGKYPDVMEVTLGQVILKCWKGEFNSAAEVTSEIERSGMLFALDARARSVQDLQLIIDPAPQYFDDILSRV